MYVPYGHQPLPGSHDENRYIPVVSRANCSRGLTKQLFILFFNSNKLLTSNIFYNNNE